MNANDLADGLTIHRDDLIYRHRLEPGSLTFLRLTAAAQLLRDQAERIEALNSENNRWYHVVHAAEERIDAMEECVDRAKTLSLSLTAYDVSGDVTAAEASLDTALAKLDAIRGGAK